MSFSRQTTTQQQPPHQPPPPLPQQQPPPQSQPRHNLEITIISAKHIKNVNWKNGDLKPYVIFWVDPDNKQITKSDDFSNTKPIWNQCFTLPIPTSILSDVVLTLEVFHSKTTETPKPFVGSTQVFLSSLIEPGKPEKIRSFDLLRPSGRPHGKIKLKFGIKEQSLLFNQGVGYNYQHATQGVGYPYSVGYYSGYYPPPPPQLSSVMRSFSDRNMSYGAPSAPVDYSPFETRFRGGGAGFGTGFGVGAVTGMLGDVAIDQGVKYEDDNVGASSVKDDFSEYRGDY